MSILVTGGAGFIGSHLCEALLERDENVICVDDFNGFYNPKFKEENIKSCLKNKKFKLFRSDITYIKDLLILFKNNLIDRIVHLAAMPGIRDSINNPHLYQKINVFGTKNLLDMAKKFKVNNFIFASSSSVYENLKQIPFSEEYLLGNLQNPYALSKKSAEDLCNEYSNLYNIPITCLRLFSVYGPRGRPDMAPYKFTNCIFHDKEVPIYNDLKSMRGYTYISDIIDGILKALDKEFNFEIINLGNSRQVTLFHLIHLIEKYLGNNAKMIITGSGFGELDVTCSDNSKTNKLLGWKPKIQIEEGMDMFIEWFIKNRT